ncbi:3-hydroxyphenylacetate 6 hydroxylase [Fusarium albosuccineum]|uniref:3-hydroxyphenylacetate 6 hydroxylase n=1 Tax=Fusarium albosuccineum TaxID=1237068 RepID=A0A8H4PB01_9HYPO|nr:3-hydroxyphenylacetate 6 hydroxylase [Fusarium albosuccineum]
MLDACHKLALNLSLTLSYGTRFVKSPISGSLETDHGGSSVEDVKDLREDLLLSEIIYIEHQITKFRDVSGNYLNYIPLLRPLSVVAGWLGSQDGRHMADVGKRRYAYHAALQENLRKEIDLGIDKPCIQGNVLKDPESKGLTEGELLSVSMNTSVFPDAEVFDPERWLDGDVTANRHQFAFGMGGRMCVASHVASKALYTLFVHLVAHFEILPADKSRYPSAWDPLTGLLDKENPQAAPLATSVRFAPRNPDKTRRMLSSSQ